MKLTSKNYYDKKANAAFMSVSQFKDFRKCEAMALAKIRGEYESSPSKALILGSFVDEMLTGTKKSKMEFVLKNRDQLFQKSSKLALCEDKDFLVFDSPMSIFHPANKGLYHLQASCQDDSLPE